MNLGFLASHNGSNMQAVLDACRNGTLPCTPALVVSNNSDSGAMERARREEIPCLHLSGKTHPEPTALDRAMLDALEGHDVDLVVLAGYMKRIGPRTLERYGGRIVNIHPALLPKFGGEGMYGRRVHEAVLAAGETETGVTVHLVDAHYDTGPILAQSRVPVADGDTVDALAARVLEEEHRFLVETLGAIASGALALPPQI